MNKWNCIHLEKQNKLVFYVSLDKKENKNLTNDYRDSIPILHEQLCSKFSKDTNW